MQPSVKFSEVVRLTRLYAGICAANLAEDINFTAFVVSFCAVVFLIVLAYAAQLKAAESLAVLLKPLCAVWNFSQGITGVLLCALKKRVIRLNCILLMSLYLRYRMEVRRYTSALYECVSRAEVTLKGLAMVILALIAVPMVIWPFAGHRLLLVRFYVPWLNMGFGYLAATGVQPACVGGFGCVAEEVPILEEFTQVALCVYGKMEARDLYVALTRPMEMLEIYTNYSKYTEENLLCFLWVNITFITKSGRPSIVTLLVIFVDNWLDTWAFISMAASKSDLNRTYRCICHSYWLQPEETILDFFCSEAHASNDSSIVTRVQMEEVQIVYTIFVMFYNFLKSNH